jgi:hypothetical protein
MIYCIAHIVSAAKLGKHDETVSKYYFILGLRIRRKCWVLKNQASRKKHTSERERERERETGGREREKYRCEVLIKIHTS